MPGSAQRGNNLVDRLIGVNDRMAKLQDRLGLRQFRVYRVLRRWDGARRSEGVARLLINEEIDPRPLVVLPNNMQGLHYNLEPGGRQDQGNVILTGISLSYTEGELAGPAPLLDTDDWYFRLEDAKGQGIKPRFFVLGDPPFADRVKSMSWVVQLVNSKITEGA